jgi:LysR family transcriptional regulator, cys regulon transcriptional activator
MPDGDILPIGRTLYCYAYSVYPMRMNLQQLRCVCETVDQGLNMSRAATALGIAQPVVSRQIQLLERELGVPIFARSRKRILSLTEPGKPVVEMARRMLSAAQGMRDASADYAAPGKGELGIATTYAHARYALPAAIRRYTKRYPDVKVSLYEGTDADIAQWLSAGRVDLSISTIPRKRHDDLVFVPYQTLHRVALVPLRHPLLKAKNLTVEALASYPLVTFHETSSGGSSIANAFRVAGLTPTVAVRASNADLIKAYVQMGVGVGIVSSLAMPSRRERLKAIDARHLFPPHPIAVGMRRGQYIRKLVHDFLALVMEAR